MSGKYLNNKAIVFGGLVVLLVVLVVMYWVMKPDAPTQNPAESQEMKSFSENKDVEDHPVASSTKGKLPILAPSLQGTEIDCPLQVDADGKLVLTVGIRSCFNYFFSALGEKTEGQLVSDIKQYLNSTLPETAASYASYLLDQYVAYNHALASQRPKEPTNKTGQIDIDAFQKAVDQMSKLQQQYFKPAEIEALFGQEQRLNQFNIEQIRIHNNKSLTTEQKATEIARLIDQLPPTLGDGVRVSMQFSELQQLTQEVKKNGGSAADLRAMRENLLGKDAADRLEKVDQDEANWQQQVNQYLSARDQILKSNDSDANKQQAINELRGSTFTSNEDQLRAQTFEKMHDRK